MKKITAALFAGLIALTGFVATSAPAQADSCHSNNWRANQAKQVRKMERRAYRQAQRANQYGYNVYSNPYLNSAAYANPYTTPYANTYANPYASAYANPYVNSYANPYLNGYGYNTGVGSTLLNSLVGLF
jgi:hypothetical protein